MAKPKPPRANLPLWVKTLHKWMAKEGWNVTMLAERCNGFPSKESLYKYRRGEVEYPGAEVLNAIAKAFGRSGYDLEHGTDNTVKKERELPLIPMNKVGTLRYATKPRVQWSGDAVQISENLLSDEAFYTLVEDDSCVPKIEQGDKITVDPLAPLVPGCFVLARIAKQQDGVVCRKFRPLSANDENKFSLIATNEDFPQITITSEDDGAIIGRVIGIYRRL